MNNIKTALILMNMWLIWKQPLLVTNLLKCGFLNASNEMVFI